MNFRVIAFTLFTVVLIANTRAEATLCQESYADGNPPKILKESLNRETEEICYSGYATKFSGISRTPLWSADHLTKDRISNACKVKRHDAFHPDPNLSEGIRSELSDYAHSGYDRGHMAPSADMPDCSSQSESFSLANMAPQLHGDNAGIWERLENGTRNLAMNGHNVYMVSGPIFEGDKLSQLKNRVMIPTAFFKAIYDATSSQAGVYITQNSEDQSYSLISVDELTQRIGIDAFPELSSDIKSKASDVIKPAQATNCPKGTRKNPC